MKLFQVAVLLAVLGSGEHAAGQDGFWLITPKEAAMPPPSTEKLREPLEAGREPPDTGPLIEVLKPVQGAPLAVPLEIAVKFVPRSAQVDLSSLRVMVMKFIDIDITDRVRPFATQTGIQIPDAKLPAGEHMVRISVADTSGGISQKQLTLTVQ
jgi:hypothetical protein